MFHLNTMLDKGVALLIGDKFDWPRSRTYTLIGDGAKGHSNFKRSDLSGPKNQTRDMAVTD